MTLRKKASLYLDLIRWDRPAGWLLLLWPTLSALWVAAQGFPGWHLLLVFVCGTILMRSAGCCINDVADKDFDRFVERTQARPLTAGRMSVTEALWLGAVLAAAAFLLVLSTNAETVALSFFALAITVIYPFSKRFFAMPQAFLGVAFSVGILMAFTAVQSQIPALAYLLLCANFFWVLAYDTEYAMVDREDDLKIGIKTMAITLGQYDVVGVIVFYLAWLGLSLWAAIASAVGMIFYLGWGLSLLQVFWHWRWIKTRTRQGCFTAFRANHWAGLTLFCGWALGFA